MSESKYGSKWTEDETILAFYWYCQIPFGKIHKSNPIICDLAALLGRTPSSVVFKMGNLGHFDPELQRQNIQGLKNASKTDKEVVLQFGCDWEGLVARASAIERQLKFGSAETLPDLQQIPEGIDRVTFSKMRVNQDFFRKAVLTSYCQTCCITGINIPELLIASHIKPWSMSNPKTERTNPSNGLCLNALHDRAFDQGLITVLPDYTIRVSSKLLGQSEDTVALWITKYDKQSIILPERFLPSREFLEYHNDMVFKP